MNKNIIFFLFNLALLLNFASCNTTEPPVDGNALALKLEDVSCTEAWITLTTNLTLPATVALKQNNNTISTITLGSADTLLYINSLMPNNNYNFQVSGSQHLALSNVVNLTTLDTTSHNFTWQSWTFGEHSSSVLNDVAIIDENNIWAVGEIYMNDSLGQPDPHPYGLAHWDGSEWNLMKVPYHDFNQSVKHPGPLFAIAVIEGEIYVVSYANLLKWNGNDWEEKAFFMVQIPFDGQVLKMWGYNGNNIYCVGRNGAIYYYFGTSWLKIESGTELNIGDIWGIPDDNGSYNKYLAADNSMLIIDNNNQLLRIDAEPGHSLSSVWGISKRLIYTAGGYGLSLYKNYSWEKINELNVNTIYNVRGQNYNDVFGLSSTFLILHFNGFNWQYINVGISNVYYRQDVKNNLIAAVGRQDQKAVITLIRRNY